VGTPRVRRYQIEDGIPLLVADSDATAVERAADHRIAEAFRRRSVSYFADNYEGRGNPERLARHALVKQRLEGLVAPGTKILEAGAGPAVLADEIRGLTSGYVALDLSWENLLAGRRRVGDVDAVVGDLTAMPFKDGVFEGVVAVGCLEYVADTELALCELTRVTKPDGFVLATFANRRSPRRWWDELVVNPLSRARRAIAGRAGESYRRRLHGARSVQRLFEASGARVTDLLYLNPGLVGHPLSAIPLVGRAEEELVRRIPPLRRTASELLVVASVAARQR
jgi:ubiquinone/menaquinone biosynthesis C-methylase UbiE